MRINSINNIGIVGMGVMGVGVAQTLAQTGLQIIALDEADEICAQARANITKNLRLYNLFSKNKSSEDIETVLSHITFTTDFTDLAKVDYLIENATEQWQVKQEIYSLLDKICPANVIFAVNTSTIPVNRIANLTKRPTKVIGAHFMNPVPLRNMVEVIRGPQTSSQTIRVTLDLLSKMDKQGIVVNDSPGFVINRILMPTINDAIRLVEEGIATVENIDKLFKGCLGHPMGPLETADLIGLDTILYSLESLYKCYNNKEYKPCMLLAKKVNQNELGNKTGRGFYKHSS